MGKSKERWAEAKRRAEENPSRAEQFCDRQIQKADLWQEYLQSDEAEQKWKERGDRLQAKGKQIERTGKKLALWLTVPLVLAFIHPLLALAFLGVMFVRYLVRK